MRYLKKEAETRKRLFLDPGASMVITRQKEIGPFQRNVVKKITWKPLPNLMGVENMWKVANKEGGGKWKSKRTRTAPYHRNIRL